MDIDWTRERVVWLTVEFESHGFHIPTSSFIYTNTITRGSDENTQGFIGNIKLRSFSDADMNRLVERTGALAAVPRLPQPVSTVEVTYGGYEWPPRTARIRRDATFAAVLVAYPGHERDINTIQISGTTFGTGHLSFTVQRNQTSGTALLRLDQVLEDGVTHFRVQHS